MLKDPMFYVTVVGLLVVVAVMRLGGWGLQRAIETSLLAFQTRLVAVCEEVVRRVGVVETNSGERHVRLLEQLQDIARSKRSGCVLVLGRKLQDRPRLVGGSSEEDAPSEPPPGHERTLDFIGGSRVEVKPGRDVSDECIQIELWSPIEAGALVIAVGPIELVQVFVGADSQTPWTAGAGMPVARIGKPVYPGSRIAVQVRALG